MRDLTEILRDFIAITEGQVESARGLDAEGLNESTDFRKELLFELEVAMKTDRVLTHQEEELVHELRELDGRLERLLTAGLATFEVLTGGAEAPVYNHEGRLTRNST